MSWPAVAVSVAAVAVLAVAAVSLRSTPPPHAGQVVGFTPNVDVAAPARVLFVGDSWTAGFGAGGFSSSGAPLVDESKSFAADTAAAMRWTAVFDAVPGGPAGG